MEDDPAKWAVDDKGYLLDSRTGARIIDVAFKIAELEEKKLA